MHKAILWANPECQTKWPPTPSPQYGPYRVWAFSEERLLPSKTIETPRRALIEYQEYWKRKTYICAHKIFIYQIATFEKRNASADDPGIDNDDIEVVDAKRRVFFDILHPIVDGLAIANVHGLCAHLQLFLKIFIFDKINQKLIPN